MPGESAGRQNVTCSSQSQNRRTRGRPIGMTDKDSSLHVAALQELEAALDAHRRTQAEAGASARADTAERLPRRAWVARPWGLRMPGWRLPFNPWFMFDRRHPVVRKTTIA